MTTRPRSYTTRLHPLGPEAIIVLLSEQGDRPSLPFSILSTPAPNHSKGALKRTLLPKESYAPNSSQTRYVVVSGHLYLSSAVKRSNTIYRDSHPENEDTFDADGDGVFVGLEDTELVEVVDGDCHSVHATGHDFSRQLVPP